MDFINEQKFAVQISWWHMDSGYFMFSPGNKPGMNNPISAAEYAENMVSLVKYLLEVKQYTCPIQLSPLNEPYNKILDATGTKFNEELFIDIVEELDRLLKKNGLRDKVKLNLGDAANSEHSAKLIEILGDYADIMNTHNYEFYNNTPNDIMHDWNKMLSDKCREKDIEHAIGEFGTRTMTDYAKQFDIDTFERALMLPRFAINSLNGGSVGAIYWVMADTYYKDPSVQMNLGLWKYKDENFELRPQYYSWSLLTRYTERNSDIYPIASEDDQICTCALKIKMANGLYWL